MQRSVPIPTGALAVVVALVAVPLALVRSDRWVFAGLGVAAVLVVAGVDFFRAVRPSAVEVEREFPATLTVGDEAMLTWLVTNTSSSAARVSVADAIWPSLQATRRSSNFVLGARRQHRFGARIRPKRRGRFPFGAVTVRTTGPLRLVQRQQSWVIAGTLAVLPAYPSREAMSRRMRIPLETGLRSVRTRGTGTDFDQLREYRPGDDIRRVDWAATARQQQPIVREYRAERNQHVVALLDNGRLMAGTVAGAPRVEHAMDAALGLAQVAAGLGDNVGLVSFDQQVRSIVPASNRRSQFGRIAEAMYLLEPSFAESAYGAAFTTAASRFRRRSLFVVYTDLVESVIADSLLPALRALTKTHLVMVAAVRDPDVAAWATPVGRGAADAARVEDAYRSAAAIASLTARERAAARLTAAGVIVVDARPGELATDVVDRYLELKASGRL
jgi:uncharacterized protein (DUF58 family)